ncbi:hypothetical protein AWZ03_004810 [Drosophila navojoa]|uniref:Uncharacterized protein n=1 Tax=Drosophila navojoa TaxID=7232 RepID=A0A484BIY1_DRONA|nr:hypothetical protein AWZ03_004810 [Drosophila navojoa]
MATLRRRSTVKGKHNKKNTAFQPIEPVQLANRDYGLVRVTNTASTPHPKIYHGVNMRTLSDRLLVQKGNEVNSETSTVKNYTSNLNVDSDKQRLTGHLSLGTPHPNKAVAMNPKVLKKRIDELSSRNNSSTDSEGAPRLRSVRSILAGRYPQTITDMVKKKVTLVTPRIIQRNSNESFEFKQHRQSLCKAEFTIARYGKKLSDQIMPKQSKSVTIDTNLIIKDLEATELIELYIQRLHFSGSSASSQMKILNVNKKMLSIAKQDIAELAKKKSSLLTIPSKPLIK